MDLSNYVGLKAAVADYLNRSDMSDRIPTFITLAEATLKRRLRRKTTRATISIAAESTTLPADVAELRSINLRTASRWLDTPLDIGTPEQLAEVRARYATAGRPIRGAMIGRKLVVAPEPDATYSADITYFSQLTPLPATDSTNDVLAESPDLYLFGALMEAAPFLEHDERIPTWERKFEKALAELNAVREAEETNASLRPARLPRRFG